MLQLIQLQFRSVREVCFKGYVTVLANLDSRIQTCIQRYRARRNLDSVRSNILTKYFILGGVECGTKAFTGGLDQETIESSTAAEIAALQASNYIRTGSGNAKYYDGSDNWVVDFEGVAKGFLQVYPRRNDRTANLLQLSQNPEHVSYRQRETCPALHHGHPKFSELCPSAPGLRRIY